jgi:hypothetical protein
MPAAGYEMPLEHGGVNRQVVAPRAAFDLLGQLVGGEVAWQDRFLVPRDSWDERDWRAQRKDDAERRAHKAELLASLDRPLVIPPPGRAVARGFSLFDRTRQRDRQRQLEANRALEKAGVRPGQRW